MLLIIPEKYFIRWETYTKFGYGGSFTPFVVRYVFSVPESSKLPADYTIYFDTDDYQMKDRKIFCVGDKEHHSGSYHIKVDDSANFTAVKTEGREEGKKYKRYHFSALQLQALYNGHDLAEADTVVAKIKIYANTHDRQANEVREEKIIVGQRVGSWLYTAESETKRLIGSRGVEILGKISDNDKEAVEKEIAFAVQKQASFANDIYTCRRNISYLKSAIDDIHKIRTSEKNLDMYLQIIKEHNMAALELLSEEEKTCEKQVEQVPVELLERLKKFYKD